MSGKEIDKLFAEKLKGHRVKPSPNAWKQLDKQLGKDDRKAAPWWKWAPLLLILLLGAGVAYHFWPTSQQKLTEVKSETQNTPISTPKSEKKQEGEKERLEDLKEPIVIKTDLATTQPKKTTNQIQSANTQKPIIQQKPKTTKVAKKTTQTQPIDPYDEPTPDDQYVGETTDSEEELTLEDTKEIGADPIIDGEGLPKNNELDSLSMDKEMVETEKSADQKELTEKKKRKRLRIEVTVPSRKKRLRRMTEGQQSQGVAIKFKKVLRNVFDN